MSGVVSKEVKVNKGLQRHRFQMATVAAIRQVQPNGLKVVSTFSGGGGTCLGLTLAGYDVVWANDCDPHARKTYTENLKKPIDGRLINDITAADILSDINLKQGELDVFEGSPPCTNFSTAGRREKGWNRREIHASKVQANTEDLFFEWIRLLDGLRPKAFVAENVAGLTKGVAKGYFKDILKAMKSLGYCVEARLLDAQWLGVPQRRNRIIFIGVRHDLSRTPVFPTPLPRQWTVRQALADLLEQPSPSWKHFSKRFSHNKAGTPWKSPDSPSGTIQEGGAGMSGQLLFDVEGDRSGYGKREIITDEPSTTVVASQPNIDVLARDPHVLDITAHHIRRKLTIPEVKRLCSFPDDYVLDGSFGKQWARLGNAVPPMMAYHIGRAIRTGIFLRGAHGRQLSE